MQVTSIHPDALSSCSPYIARITCIPYIKLYISLDTVDSLTNLAPSLAAPATTTRSWCCYCLHTRPPLCFPCAAAVRLQTITLSVFPVFILPLHAISLPEQTKHCGDLYTPSNICLWCYNYTRLWITKWTQLLSSQSLPPSPDLSAVSPYDPFS